MILVTTTPSVDGYTITNYQGIVFGEVVSGVNMFKDLGAGLRNMFGGRSQGYEEELMQASAEPECYYDDVIMTYTGLLEEWYVTHQGLRTYLLSIFTKAWVVLVPASTLVWKLFPGLPAPPVALRGSV